MINDYDPQVRFPFEIGICSPANNHQRTNWLPVQRGYGSGRTQSHLDGQVLRPPRGIKPIGFMWSEVGPDEICFWRSKAISSSLSRTSAFCENVWDKYKFIWITIKLHVCDRLRWPPSSLVLCGVSSLGDVWIMESGWWRNLMDGSVSRLRILLKETLTHLHPNLKKRYAWWCVGMPFAGGLSWTVTWKQMIVLLWAGVKR